MPLCENAWQQCVSANCGNRYQLSQTLTSCEKCGNLLDIKYDWEKLNVPRSLQEFEKFWQQRSVPQRRSGVWQFHELLPFADLNSCVTVGEGQTILQQADRLASFTDLKPGNLFLQYEGQNPSGSFKDNGMAAALTHAKISGSRLKKPRKYGN